MIRTLASLVIVTASFLLAQQQQAQQPAAQQPGQPAQTSETPVAPQPQPKSAEEQQGLQAIFQATDADGRIKAAEDFLVKFPDSQFKGFVLMVTAEMYRQKNDFDKMVIYGERALEADPKNYMAMIMLGQGLAQRTREFDLDREEKLGRAEKYANTALEILKTAPRPRPDITDQQWAQARKEFEGQAHEALGMAALVRKKYDAAISEFRTAIESSASPDPATQVRLATALNQSGKPDEAITILEKVMADPNAHPVVKQFAQAERARAVQAKGGGAKPASPPPAAQPGTPSNPQPAPAPKP